MSAPVFQKATRGVIQQAVQGSDMERFEHWARYMAQYDHRADSLFEAQAALEFVHSTTMDVVQQPTEMDRFVPSIPTAPPADEQISWDSFNSYGKAKLSARDANDDTPMVGTDKNRYRRNVLFYKLGRKWSWDDILKASGSRDPASRLQQQRLIEQVTRGMMLLRDDLMFAGNAEFGAGNADDGSFAKDANVNITSATTGNWVGGGATGAQVLADITAPYNTMVSNTLGTIRGRQLTLAMSPAEYDYMVETSFGSATDANILTVVLQRLPWLGEVIPYERLRTADLAGTGPRAVLYDRSSRVLAAQDPLLPTFQSPFQKGVGQWEQEAWGLTGGVTWFYPREGQYLDGI